MKLALVLACVPALAWADEPQPAADTAEQPVEVAQPPADAPVQPVPEPQPPLATPELEELTAELDDLRAKDKQLERRDREHAAKLKQLEDMKWLTRYIDVFVDVGAFAVGGDGSGIRPDIGHVYFPQYTNKVAGKWVFMGDPLSTAINSLGEPSDTSTSRSLGRDTINSEGQPSFVVSSIGLSIGRYIKINDTQGFSISALALLLPRPEHTMLDVQLANVGYRPLQDVNLVIEVGKVDSVLGVEYRSQDATKRIGITPSLICRYTCGRPLGVRAQLTEGRLSVSATLTNGDNFQQLFEPDPRLKSNGLPTASGHLQWTLPLGQGLQVGVSGAIGPQDGQPDSSLRQWHVGFDARLLDLDGFDVSAELVQGKQPGKTDRMVRPDQVIECDIAPCLRYKGAYLLVDRRVTQWLIPYVRADWRSAVHIDGTSFVYESHTFRTTVGTQVEVTTKIIGKVEYTYNRELGGIPQFPDDILTSSLVVKTD